VLVLTFNADGRDNSVTVAGVTYVFARAYCGEFVMPARCAHRGGPLHLARFQPGTTRLVCPWHGRATSVTRALKAGIPAVRRGNSVTVVLPYDEGTEYTLQHRPLSPDLSHDPICPMTNRSEADGVTQPGQPRGDR
jgi:nitrite reductase (NADH) small subunit